MDKKVKRNFVAAAMKQRSKKFADRRMRRTKDAKHSWRREEG